MPAFLDIDSDSNRGSRVAEEVGSGIRPATVESPFRSLIEAFPSPPVLSIARSLSFAQDVSTITSANVNMVGTLLGDQIVVSEDESLVRRHARLG